MVGLGRFVGSTFSFHYFAVAVSKLFVPSFLWQCLLRKVIFEQVELAVPTSTCLSYFVSLFVKLANSIAHTGLWNETAELG